MGAGNGRNERRRRRRLKKRTGEKKELLGKERDRLSYSPSLYHSIPSYSPKCHGAFILSFTRHFSLHHPISCTSCSLICFTFDLVSSLQHPIFPIVFLTRLTFFFSLNHQVAMTAQIDLTHKMHSSNIDYLLAPSTCRHTEQYSHVPLSGCSAHLFCTEQRRGSIAFRWRRSLEACGRYLEMRGWLP